MTEPITSPASAKLMRIAIWVAIGALIAAAFVCVVWVLFGPESGIVARAFLTILLLAAFAGVAILDAHLADSRPAWFALASMASWVIALLVGSFMIWMPYAGRTYGSGVGRFVSFLLIVLILQLALLHIRLFTKAHARHVTTFTTIVTYVTVALVVVLAIMLVIPLMLTDIVWFEAIYWRIVVALAILAAVGTALVPLVTALFAPRKPRPAAHPAHAGAAQIAAAPHAQPQAWPTYVDGYTPLPVMPDGSPDWNAYYTGYPTYPQPGYGHAPAYAPQAEPAQPPSEQAPPPSPAAPPAAPEGYEGYPPPPPLPPRD